MQHVVTLIPGDGIGPEVVYSAVRCIEASGVDIHWNIQVAGDSAMKRGKSSLPDVVVESVRRNKVALKGPITTPVGYGFRSVNVSLRQTLGLFANVRPAKTYFAGQSSYDGVDIVIIRENTEDLYAGIEFRKGSNDTRQLIGLVKKTKKEMLTRDTAVSLKTISRHASQKISKFAFDYAVANKRKKVTAVHKANIMKFTDGLFLETARSVAKKYRRIEFEDRIVDNMAMQLVQNPQEFDVLLCPNLYGDILSDLCAGLTGGLGMAPSANIGDRCAVFEPVHGSAPKYAHKNKVNPSAAILSAAMMLRHLGEKKAADRIEKSLIKVIKGGRSVTYDIAKKKPVSTSRMTDAVVKLIEK